MKNVLITGGSRGIGKACVYEFSNNGYRVFLNYNKSIDEAEKIKNDLINKRFDNIKIEKKVVNEDPPLPFNLVKLQSYCSSHFGYNPADVMDITQSLRETHKAITVSVGGTF